MKTSKFLCLLNGFSNAYVFTRSIRCASRLKQLNPKNISMKKRTKSISLYQFYSSACIIAKFISFVSWPNQLCMHFPCKIVIKSITFIIIAANQDDSESITTNDASHLRCFETMKWKIWILQEICLNNSFSKFISTFQSCILFCPGFEQWIGI